MGNQQVIEVAFDLPLQRIFDYLLDDEQQVGVGCRVVVPFGSRLKTGVVVRVKEKSALPFSRLKGLHRILDTKGLLTEELVDFCRWMASYYHCGWGEALAAALPGGLGTRFGLEYLWVEHREGGKHENWEGLSAEIIGRIERRLKRGEGFSDDWWRRQRVGEDGERWLRRMLKTGVIMAHHRLLGMANGKRQERWIRLTDAHPMQGFNPRRETKRERILQLLQEEGEIPIGRVRVVVNNPTGVLHQLQEEGLVKVRLREKKQEGENAVANIEGIQEEQQVARENFLSLNQKQLAAFIQIQAGLDSGQHKCFLLQGVTGSGKTEVYLHAVRHALKQGRSCLILAPEIALSTNLIKRFQLRFGQQVVLLHSGLDAQERMEGWLRLRTGKAQVVIGARSAVFAPLERLGLVVVDEEHDGSYKQEDAPRYHARDAAIIRARHYGALVLLGTATPSMESWWAVKENKLKLLELPQRVRQQPLPQMQLVDLRHAPRQPGSFYFSRTLSDAIRHTLAQKQQVMLFLNRRGFASMVLCQDCQTPVLCENCTLALTWHQSEAFLLCHRCGFKRAFPAHCHNCRSENIQASGIGIQRAEEEASIFFPQARILRLDSDALRRRNELERLLKAIAQHQCDIVIGTQILAKGHHFPQVTLVGMLLADLSLNLPDFRASERTFQLLTQMAGRAGRGTVPGKAIIQTYNPQHYSLQTTLQHQFTQFAQRELQFRQQALSPPFLHQVLLWIDAPTAPLAQQLAQQIATRIKKHLSQHNPTPILLGPAPAHIPKVKRFFRFFILLKHPRSKILHQLLQSLPQKIPHQSRITVDVDPYQLF